MQITLHKDCQISRILANLFVHHEYTTNMAAWLLRSVQWCRFASCIQTN